MEKFFTNARLEQTAPFVSRMVLPPNVQNIARLPGGSRGMATYRRLEDVPQVAIDEDNYTVITGSDIKQWVLWCSKMGYDICWMMNINDSVRNQIKIMQEIEAYGGTISYIEFGNEIYLPKFFNGDTTQLGCTRQIRIEDYVLEYNEAEPDIRAAFPFAELAMVICEPVLPQRRIDFFNGISDYITDNPTKVDAVVVHVYVAQGEDENFDFDVINLFNPIPKPLWITESGDRNVDNIIGGTWPQPQTFDLTRQHLLNIKSYLDTRADFSINGHHVLHQDSNTPGHPYNMYDNTGLTPVGVAKMQYPYLSDEPTLVEIKEYNIPYTTVQILYFSDGSVLTNKYRPILYPWDIYYDSSYFGTVKSAIIPNPTKDI